MAELAQQIEPRKPEADLVVLRPEQLRELVRDAVAEALAERTSAEDSEALLDRTACAKRLGCSVQQLDRLIRGKGLPFIRLGDVKRFEWARVLEWARGQSTTGDVA